jgi:hypothetical protein
VDYDHPHRNRPRLGPQLCLLLALAASVTLLWVVGSAVSHFQLLNQAGGAVPGTVVGYEFVGYPIGSVAN